MAGQARTLTKAEEALAANFAALPADDPAHAAREAAFDVIRERGLPHRRIEDWKYTDLRNLMRDAPPPAAPAAPDAAKAAVARADIFAGMDRARITFVNGQFVPSLSDLADIAEQIDFASFGRFLADGGAVLEPFRGAEEVDSPIQSLNAAFVTDGAVLRVREGASLTKPLELLTVYAGETPGLQTLRHRVHLEAGSAATILETYAGPDGVAYHTNVVVELRVDDGAALTLVRAEEEGDGALHLGLSLPRLGADARFDPFSFAAGGAIVRNELRMAFEGEGSRAAIRGATIAGGRQHLDFTLFVDHAVPNCESAEFFKSAIGGEGQGVFQGRILVRPGAQKTEAKMMSRALLLSERAQFANKPELEIFADDVVCGHGATCGQIDADMLFFMRARGIGEEEAKRLLVQAFLAEAIEEIGDEAIVAALEARTRLRLGAGEGAG